jgi:hypothetical protein
MEINMSLQSEITLILNFAGQANAVIPRDGRLYCPANTLAQVSAAGFLDNYLKTQSMSLLPTDFVLTVASDGHQIYKPVFTNGSCQLTVLP